MMSVLSIILFLIFTLLGMIHIYWLLGGKWGVEQVIPIKNDQVGMPTIPKFATLIVALGLFSFALLYLSKLEFVKLDIPYWINDYASWGVPSIFILRAIGEFKNVGFFKKIKHTEFGKADSKWFSPLCLVIGIIGIAIQLMSR